MDLSTFTIAAFEPYGLVGWYALVALVVACGFVAYGITEASKQLRLAIHVPKAHTALWQWTWRGVSVLAGAVCACVLGAGWDPVLALIGAVSGACNAAIVTLTLSRVKGNIERRQGQESPT